MKYTEIRALFEDNCDKCYMTDDEDSVLVGMYQTDNLLEMDVRFDDGKNVTIFFGDRVEYIDVTNTDDDRYVGLGSVLISPMRDIAEIDIKWRR